MDRETVIGFFISLLESCQIPARRFKGGDPGEYDLGMRRSLGMDPYANLPLESAIRHNTVYDLTDIFSWRYHLLRLPESNEFLLIGPYLRESVSDETLMSIMERAGIPPAELPKLCSYYRQIVVCPSESMLYAAIGRLAEALWGSADAFTTRRKSLELLDVYQPAEDGFPSILPESFDRERIERSYQGEEALMYAIAHGKTHRAHGILSQFSIAQMEKRSAVPLRNFKNYLIILNTLMRKAVQQGGVHPMYIDRTSSAIAHRIEQCMTLNDGYRLIEDMIHKYCLLVKNHNMTQYSQLVQNVILQIDSELSGDLSLRAHAERLGVNASYLSALFKKETGMTLTDYVNQKRIDFAIYLLNASNMQIQTIAQHCGIPDVNYFTRTFRKIIGITPSQYRRHTRRE
ncbi:MAG: AraC family transcriptional regulator [Clostridia bacterium]|nr:AraC family transcriptional regulator [Clostridia bacterium]